MSAKVLQMYLPIKIIGLRGLKWFVISRDKERKREGCVDLFILPLQTY
jgi:hypothetical protein